MKITIKQIAQEAGVSVTTVSNVINKKAHRVSKDKIELIESIIQKYNYTPNMNARALVQSSSRLIGLLYYSENEHFRFSDPFVTEVLEGIERCAKERGYFTLIHNVTSVADIQSVQRNWKFEGFIAVGVSEEFFEEIDAKIDAPIVFIDTHLSSLRYAELNQPDRRMFINTDDYQAGLTATSFLIGKGHEDIAFLTYPFQPDRTGVIQSRFKGYKEALKIAQIDYDGTLVFTNEKEDLPIIAANLDRFTAIVVTADFLAVELIHYLKEKNLYDQKQTSIISFDDIRYARLNDPPLTTIRLDQVSKGELAMITLSNILEKKEYEADQLKILMGELVVRKSVTEGPRFGQIV